MALVKELLEVRQEYGEIWYNVYSDTEGKAVMQMNTGTIFGNVTMRDDDPHEYRECDDPNYIAEGEEDETTNTDSAV